MNILNGGSNLMLYTCTGYEPQPKTPGQIAEESRQYEELKQKRKIEWDAYLEKIRAKTDAQLIKDTENENDGDYDNGGPNTDELIRRFKIYAGAML